MNLAGYEVDDRIAMPAKSDYGIGIVGCGGIVNYAHLPAYRAHGLNVRAVYDRDAGVAERTAREHGIGRVATSLDEMLSDPTVEIVDIAVTPSAQAGIALRAIAAGKHLLCQKPLAAEYADAVAIVDAARGTGVRVAVNQQMRWTAGIRVARQLIDQGALGRLAEGRIAVSVETPWRMWPWIAASERLEIMFHSIHHLDSLRACLGDPVRVRSVHSRFPGQSETGETRTITTLEYDGSRTGHTDIQHHNWSDDAHATFRFLGTDGIVSGTLGTLYDYPTGRVDTLAYQARAQSGTWHEAALSTRWIPDAFAGPMASLMESIQSGGQPVTSAADNLVTLQVVFAAYRSAAEGRAVALAEIAAESAPERTERSGAASTTIELQREG